MLRDDVTGDERLSGIREVDGLAAYTGVFAGTGHYCIEPDRYESRPSIGSDVRRGVLA